MINKAIDFIVRFAALLSLIGLITGYSKGNSALQVTEVIMIAIWFQMDFKNIKSLIKRK